MEVNLRGADVGKQISLDGSTFEQILNMDSVSVGDSLLMREADFGEVRLTGAHIGTQLSMTDSVVRRSMIVDSVTIENNLFIRGSDFYGPAEFIFLEVGSILDARFAKLSRLNLSGTHVKKDLVLGTAEGAIEWRRDADAVVAAQYPRLVLRNTVVGALQDSVSVWPDNLSIELEGFSYKQFEGFQEKAQPSAFNRGSAWFVEWLKKDGTYSPQPYRQLAGVLRAAGRHEMAEDILFASFERERGQYSVLE